MAIIDVVKFDGLKTRDWIVYKHPSDQLVLGTQLTVKEGQVAIFMKDGQIADIFEPGRYTLSTENLPILRGLINIPFGGTTPFPAEIYFLNTLTKLDIPWGTADPMQVIDPKFKVKLRIRAFGQMGMKLSDYRTFFTELIGAMPKSDAINYERIYDFYRSLIIQKVKVIISGMIINDQISALEIQPRLEEISDKVKVKISEEIAKYGLNVTTFYVQSISFPDEDFAKVNRILEDQAAFDIMGDKNYVTKRSFDVYQDAARNEGGVSGAMAAGGMGIGLGAGMMNAMQNQMPNPMMQQSMQMQAAAMQKCPNCGADNPSNSKFCCSCGKPMVIAKITCPGCGAQVNEGSKFCNECGMSLVPKVCECGATLAPGSKFCNNCGKKVD